MVGLLDKLTFDQQSEMIYVGYFNRAADEGGFSFWASQNAQAQAGGQSACSAARRAPMTAAGCIGSTRS
jgi:hypothetical protein